MIQFLIKRLLGLVFVVLSVSFITFIFGYFAPGDPIKAMLGQHFDPQLYATLKHQYGLDVPWYQQYFNYVSNLFRLDLGYSYHYQNEKVWNLLKNGVPVSTELGFWALLLTLIVAIPAGVLSALKANTWIDTTNMAVAMVLYALPTFIIAVFFQVLILALHKGVGLQWPVSNWGVPWRYTWDDIQYKIGPIIVYTATSFAFIARLTRTSVIEVLRQDYVRTARAKGLIERIVVYRHSLRNAMIPLVTVIGLAVGTLVTGIFFIEQIFNINGIASTTLQAIGDRDYPVIQATAMLGAIAVVVGNLISDLLYTVVDPRIKAE